MTDSRSIVLLDAEPDLGRLLAGERLEEARRHLVVRAHTVPRGPWDGERLRDAGPEHVGLMLLDGLMSRELALADNVSAELLGPGDLVRPWQAAGPAQLVPFDLRWTVLEEARLAVLDRRFNDALTQFPEVNAMLIDRLTERAQRLSLMQAISQLNGVDRRLLTLFWHLAERWGRVTPEGVQVSMDVPHRVLAQLVGARRPTVSTALSGMAGRGELVRTSGGGWLLTGSPFGMPSGEAARIVRQRRRHHAALPERERLDDATRGGAELHEVLEALRADNVKRREELQTLRGRTTELMEQIAAARARRERPVRP